LENNSFTKTKERIITFAIPTITAVMLGLVEIFGKDYLSKILLIGLGFVLLLVLLFFAFKFLEKREIRWENMVKNNENITSKINLMEKEINHLKEVTEFNKKINKLEKSLGYILGSLRKK